MSRLIPSIPMRQWWLVGLSMLAGCDAGRRDPLPAPMPAPPNVSAPAPTVADRVESKAAATRIAGRVADDTGQPLAGATVLLCRARSDGLQPSPTMTTSGDGRFAFDSVAQDYYDVLVHAPGRGFDLAIGLPPGTLTLDFALPPEALFAGSVVLDADGSPVAGASISLDVPGCARAAVLGEARSGPDGRFELRGLRAGGYLAGAAHDELVLAGELEPITVSAGKVQELRLVMKRGIELACQVVDAQTRVPVAGARVELRKPLGEAGMPPPVPRAATADGQGRLVVKGLAEGVYTASVSARGYVGRVDETFAVAPGVAEATFALEHGGTIAGRVLDAAGQPLAGARVEVAATCMPPEDHGLILEPSTTTGADGRYRLAGLPAWPFYKLVASRPGHAFQWRSDIDLEPGGAVEGADITLRRGATIRGRVLDEEGKGIAGAQVNIELIRFCSGDPPETIPHLQDRWVESGEDGVYIFPDTAPAHYWLEASAPERFRDRTDIRILEEVETYTTDFHLARPEAPAENAEVPSRPTGIVAGRIRAPGDAVLSNLWLRAVRLRQGIEWEREWRSAGFFELPLEEGSYVIQASAADCSPVSTPPIVVEAGGRRDGIVLQLDAEAVIEGRVTLATPGGRLEGAEVLLRPRSFLWPPMKAILDDEGRFEIRGVPAGELDLVADAWRVLPSTVAGLRVEAGERRVVDFELRPGGGIIARASTREGPLTHVGSSVLRGTVEYWPYYNATGDLLVSGLEAGFYLLRVEGRTAWIWDNGRGSLTARASNRFEYEQDHGGTTLIEQQVSVIEGETATIDVVEGPRTRVHGQATIAGVPASGLWVQALHAWRTWPAAWSRTDASGGFELSVAPGETTVLVAPGAGDARAGEAQFQLTVPGRSDEARIDLVLPTAAIRGTVVKAGTAIPVEGAVVEAIAHGERFPSFHALRRARKAGCTTDRDGRFLLPFLPPGKYLVVAMAGGFADARLEEVQVGDVGVERGGQAHSELKLELRPGGGIQLRAVDAKMFAVSGFSTVVRDASGNLGTPLAGPCEVTVLHPDFAPARIAVPDIAKAEKQVVVLERGGALAVRADDASGRPLAGAVVEVRDAAGREVADDLLLEVTIDADAGPIPPPESGPGGEVYFEHLAPGSYTVLARLGGLRSAVRDVTVVESRLVEARLVLPGK